MILLSASSIKDFISCERKYWYRRFASDKGAKTEETARGLAVHKALEKYSNNKSKALKYVTRYSESVINTEKAEQAVLNFFDKFKEFTTNKDEIEQKFKIPYRPEYSIVRDVNIIGMFDRVTPEGIIFDWKTNRSLPRNLNNDPQFMLYHHAYTVLHNKPPAAVYFASLTAGRLLKFKFDGQLFNILYTEVIKDMIDTINSKKFNPTGLFRYTTCKFCFFREHCHEQLGLENKDELDSKKFNFR